MDNQKLLQKYWSGKCSPAELRQLYQYLQSDQVADYEPLLSQLWQQLPDTHSLDPPASARIYRNIVSSAPGLDTVVRARRRWIGTAAAIGLLLVATYLIGFFLFPKHKTYQTTFGEIRQVVLPDSTVVDLNANSQLRVATAFDTKQPREVWLSGEAYFHVKPRRIRDGKVVRFVVHTSQVDVEVTGTTFNVKDRRGATDVILNSGSVLLRKPTETKVVAMEPGDRVRFTPEQAFVRTQVDEPTAYASWKEHELYFEDQSLFTIQQELSDSYNISLRFGDPTLGELRFTGSAPTEDPTVLIRTIQKSFNLTLKSDDYGYTLTQ